MAEATADLDRATSLEVWFQDEMRIGQKNTLVRQWAKKGQRPRQPHDQRTQSAYLFGAVCPALDKGAALILPRPNTHAMQLHIDEITQAIAPGAHAILIMDGAGWHTTDKLTWPDNITPLVLPPRSPELNPVENIWQFLRQAYLANRVFETYQQIIDACDHAWNSLLNETGRIHRTASRSWAKVWQPS